MTLSATGSGQRIDFALGHDAIQAPQWRGQPLQHALQPLLFDAPIRGWSSSPTENIFVTGNDSGSVSVWFATPTIAPDARELSTLEAHRSSALSVLQFSSLGQALFTSAANREAYLWPVATEPSGR